MLKLAAIVLATAGAAGTTYVVTRPSSSPPPTAAPATVVASAPIEAPVTAAPAARPTPPRAAPPAAAAQPGAGTGSCAECNEHQDDHEGEALDPVRIEQVGLYRGPSRGPADAPVQIAVYQDLECPYCAAVMGTIDQLWDEYPGQLRLVVKDFPLPHHAHAQLAAEATRAADAQGKLWEFRDLALAFQDDLTRPALIALAGRAGLDVPRFTADLDQHRFADAIAADLAGGRQLDVDGTPSFFINGKRYTGAQPIEAFRAAIDATGATRATP